jgi:hypothetical protein
MRKFILAAAIAALGAAVVASPAFAFDHHFKVLGKAKSSHRTGQNTFVLREKLLDPNNRHNKVGRDRLKCRAKPRKIKCRVKFHLNGKIGGFGDIKARGDLDPGPDHLVVYGGSDDFDGVAGKVTARTPKGPTRIHFDLVR